MGKSLTAQEELVLDVAMLKACIVGILAHLANPDGQGKAADTEARLHRIRMAAYDTLEAAWLDRSEFRHGDVWTRRELRDRVKELFSVLSFADEQ